MTNDAKPTAKRPQPRFAPGPLGRGVYLSDLVRWLMEKHEATRVQVVKEHLCPVMLEKQPLFGDVKRSGDAAPISEGAEWSMTGSGYVENVPPASGRRFRPVRVSTNRTRVEEITVNTDSIGKGVDAAVKWLLNYWGYDRNADTCMDNDSRASLLAISEADARRCWGWRSVDEAAPAVDAVAKPVDAPPAVDHAGKPSDTSDAGPAWLTEGGYNVAWLQGERDKFRLKGGAYMAKLIAHLETEGVQVPGKDKKKEIDRYTDGKPREKKATHWGGLVASKKAGAR